MSSDIANDDDMVVQDILNQINASSNAEGNQPSHPQQSSPSIPLQQLLIQQPQHVSTPNNMTQQPMHTGSNPMFMQQQAYHMPQMDFSSNMFPSIAPTQQDTPMDYKSYIIQMAGDLKLAGLVFAVVIIAHFVPIESYISKYFAVDKIPYHEVILRAIMVALLVIIIKKLLKI
jgi:hypothetical protein